MAPIIVKSLSPEEREALRLRGIAEREAAEARKVAEDAARVERNRKRARRWGQENSEKVREYNRAYRANYKSDPVYAARQRRNKRSSVLRTKYGLTSSQFEAMFESQGRRCANLECGATEPGGRWRGCGWHVDHCHDTGRVRGILCHSCNVGIGHFRNDPARLRAAADYLEKFQMQRLRCEPLEVEDA